MPKKKFAAPKPPEQKQEKYFGANEDEHQVSRKHISSPLPFFPSGREAMEILDDLYNTLDDQSDSGGGTHPHGHKLVSLLIATTSNRNPTPKN
uniref:Uncharacterized protein n=1 Tax=Ditylenchus dipsaci TaxID=166011 RepID=A0A915CYL7_9BILA